MLSTNVLLGAIAGLTIFLGLPIARWRGASERLRGMLTLASAGVLLFLIIEVGYHAMEAVEVSAQGGAAGAAIQQGLILVIGFTLGLVGLAWIEERRNKRHAEGASALEVATMIAIGIGLHNFAEGLAIGQTFAGGAVALGTVLVIGFALHNATEGFGIAAPLAGRDIGWGRLLWLGFIGGAPTALGAAIGGVWVSPSVELLFLSLAVGSLVYVTRELFRIRFATLNAVSAMAALAVGVLLGFGTELVIGVAQSRSAAQAAGVTTTNATVRFANKQVEPGALTLARGSSLTIKNDGSVPLVFEGNGLFIGEVVAPAGGSIIVTATGAEGRYALVDERGQSAPAAITVQPSGALEPLTDEVNAVGALTVLEGHVRASKDLHDRGASNQGTNPALDLKRAGKHAGHPQHELLEGSEPDALALQRLLKSRGVFDELNDALTAYVQIAGNGALPKEEVDRKYDAALAATERARRAIAGDAYDTPSFRARAVRFVMETAASEYATATTGGRISVEEAGTPGKDNYIEYQDARGFLRAARDLLFGARSTEAVTTPDARAVFDELINKTFATLDPSDPDRPIPAVEVKSMIERVERGLNK